MSEIPLGERESKLLEFKSAEVLRRPARVAREAVAMLNALAEGEQGVIWVGLAEEEGVAVRVEGIASPDVAREALLNHLVDTLEPPPVGELDVRVVETPSGAVLRVIVNPQPNKRPYAQLEKSARFFYLRVDDRIRSMTREEIAGNFRQVDDHGPAEDSLADALARLAKNRNDIIKSGLPMLWMKLVPCPALELEDQSNQVKELFIIPSRSGNRDSGWTFANPYQDPRPISNGIQQGVTGGRLVSVKFSGEVTFQLPLSDLHWKGDEKEIWPFALMEFLTSVTRLTRVLHDLGHGGKQTSYLADLVITSLKGWYLRAYSPHALGFQLPSHKPQRAFPESEFVLDQPLRLSSKDLESSPDRCAYRLYRQVYQAFGIWEDEIPAEYNRETGQLSFPG